MLATCWYMCHTMPEWYIVRIFNLIVSVEVFQDLVLIYETLLTGLWYGWIGWTKYRLHIHIQIISKEDGPPLKDNLDGGATWAFEVGAQSMVCPIIVEDLNPPRQMLVKVTCFHAFTLFILLPSTSGHHLWRGGIDVCSIFFRCSARSVVSSWRLPTSLEDWDWPS